MTYGRDLSVDVIFNGKHSPMCTTDDIMLPFPRSVSETIRKASLAEAENKKIRSVERRYLSHHRNLVKNCFSAQFFTEIGC